MNNTKLKNYPTAILKLFFERNNKSTTTVTNLGNVFRNSKWSDLKIQNTKNLFIGQYVSMWGVILILVIVLSLVLTFGNPSIVRSYWLLRLGIYDWFFDITFALGIVVYTLSLLLRNYTSSLIQSTVKNTLLTDSRHTSETGSYTVPTKTDSLTSNQVELVHTMYKLKHCLDLADHSTRLNQFTAPSTVTSTLSFNNQVLVHSLRNTAATTRNNPLNLVVSNSSSRATRTLLNNFRVDASSVTNLDLSAVGIYDTNTPMSLAKQERWLLKNSLVSRNLSNSNNSTVDAKKLIGSAVMDSNISNRNLWVSNLYSGNNMDFMFAKSNLSELLTSYNFNEESREFFMKRYMFLINQQLLNTTHSVSLTKTGHYTSTVGVNNYNLLVNTDSLNNLITSNLFNYTTTHAISIDKSTTTVNSSRDVAYDGTDAGVLNPVSLPIYVYTNNTSSTKYTVSSVSNTDSLL